MKNLIVLIIALFSCLFVTAQNVVLSGSLTGSFPTLKAALEAINTGGGSGNVVATVIGNTTETAVAVLRQTNYTLLVQPEGNRTVAGAIDTAVLLLDGADNVTIDGKAITGANTLTFRNTNAYVNAVAIRLLDAASNNTIKKCIIEASSNATLVNSAAVVINTSSDANSLNNIIDGNLIRPSTADGLNYGISVGRLFTNTLGEIINTQVTNNLIENVFIKDETQNVGILIRNNVKSTLIKANSVYNTATYTNTVNGATFYGIRINSTGTTTGGGNTIEGNFFGGTAPGATGGKMVVSSPGRNITVCGIYVDENRVAEGSFISHNTIRNIDLEAENPNTVNINPFIGIYVLNANLQTMNNNILGDAANGSINIIMRPSNTGVMGCFGFFSLSGCTQPVANNFIGGINVTASPLLGSISAPFFDLIDIRGGTSSISMKNNIIGSATPNNISINNTVPALFALYGLTYSSPAAIASIRVDSNTVQNIVASNTSLNAVAVLHNNAAATNAAVTMNANLVNDLSLTGTSSNATGVYYNTTAPATALEHSFVATDNIVKNVAALSGSGISLRGIVVSNGSASEVNRIKGKIANNLVANIRSNTGGTASLSRGISFGNDIIVGDSMVIANNTVSGITDASEIVSSNSLGNSNGIVVTMNNSGTNGLAIIRDNIINEIVASATANAAMRVHAITVYGNSVVVERNRMYNIQNAAQSASARLEPILLRSRTDDFNSAIVRNNMVAVNTATAAQVTGIRLWDGTINAKLYHNSILIEGANTTNSYGIYKEATAVADVKNNILYNAATGAGSAFAIGLQTNANGYSGNNNYLVSPLAASLASIGSASHTLASWQAATANDASSQQKLENVPTNPANLFTNKAVGELLINTADPTEGAKPSNAGMPLSTFVPTDFLNVVRSISTPDIGAHEFDFVAGIYWTGNVSTEWENPANWGNFKVPDATTDVIIPTGRPRYPIISINTAVKSISAAPATSVHVAAGVLVTINGK